MCSFVSSLVLYFFVSNVIKFTHSCECHLVCLSYKAVNCIFKTALIFLPEFVNLLMSCVQFFQQPAAVYMITMTMMILYSVFKTFVSGDQSCPDQLALLQ